MIRYIKGDLFSVTSGVIAHGCNCIGAMGAGVAKIVRERYPEAFLRYTEVCKINDAKDLLGTTQIVRVSENLYIANCFTQLSVARNPGIRSRQASVEAIEESLIAAAQFCQTMKIGSIAMPKIGAGLGGLDWECDVEPVLKRICEEFSDIHFEVYYI